uniref:CD302 antigen n=1 Tax=Sarcophilus harrisii TaxID=9305 RepID=A0A7N4PBM7_SARHA
MGISDLKLGGAMDKLLSLESVDGDEGGEHSMPFKMLRAGRWKSRKEGNKYLFKTYYIPDTVLSALEILSHFIITTTLGDCPSSTWVQFQSNCYIFLETSIKIGNIEDVRNQCTDYASGADMISIHNEEENAFILETFKKRWKSQDDILLGMFYDTDDESFKWYDKSNMTFNKWKNSEDSPNLIDTCAFFQTKSGIWKKGNCEVSSVEGALCKAAVSYEKKYLPDNHILITALVIASTTILTITGAIVWFLYKRNLTSGLTNTSYTTAPQLSYNDDCILVDAEENEYIA